LNLGEPIGVEALLITIAGAFSDNIDKSLLTDSYWDHLLNYLAKTEVSITQGTFKMNAVEFKAELKNSPTFQQRVRQIIQSRLPEVQRQVQAFVQGVVNRLQEKAPGKRIVFLFDSFEKLRGTPSNEQEIMASVERLFGSYMDILQLPFVHCVYSVPAFVQFFVTYGELVLIPTIKVWEKRIAGQPEVPHEPGLDVLRSIIRKRFGDTAQRRISGEPDEQGKFRGAELLITASGGALRDLLRLFREALRATKSLPIPDRVLQQAVAIARNDFKTTIEDARWLNKIHKEHRPRTLRPPKRVT
jgi:hypothetical protein